MLCNIGTRLLWPPFYLFPWWTLYAQPSLNLPNPLCRPRTSSRWLRRMALFLSCHGQNRFRYPFLVLSPCQKVFLSVASVLFGCLSPAVYNLRFSPWFFQLFFFWQPIASVVMMQPVRQSRSNSLGIATISLLLSSTLSCPKLILFFMRKAVTMWIGYLRLLEPTPRMVFPSNETTSLSTISAIDFIQFIKHSPNDCGSNRANKSLIASCEGVPYW